MREIELGTLALVGLLVVVRAVLLWRSAGINPFKLGHPAEASFVVIALAFAGAIALEHPDIALIDLGVARWSGLVLMGAALAILVAALAAFGDSWRVGIDTRTPGKLVTGGIFAFTRNPIFVCMDLYLLGTFILNGTLVFLLIAVVGLATIHLQIVREERFLTSRYGEEYVAYCCRTPRYMGWPTQK